MGTLLNLSPAGYRQPVSLDFYDGRLRVLVNADKDIDGPKIIDLELAKLEEEEACPDSKS